jgi:hypothetical protein
MKTLQVGSGEYSRLTNETLQRACDALFESGGGTLEIPAGIYAMRNALHLREGVHVAGEAGTILQKTPGGQSALTHVCGYGHYEFRVAEPDKFQIGDGVLISDNNAGGFYTTAATITARDGDLFFIDRPFSHDYNPQADGKVTSIFSILDAHNIRGASASNLVLDGNFPIERNVLNGCRGGGAFLLGAHEVALENIEVKNFHGDALSFQQCTDISISNCFLHHNTGGGLHPGSGSVRYFLRENKIENNGGCGIFYCLRTTHSLCENNVIIGNKSHGISIGERDTDHVVRGNTIQDNGGAGIAFRAPVVQSGERVWIENNVLQNNNRDQQSAEIFIARGLRDVAVIGNRIGSTSDAAIIIEDGCENIFAAKNHTESNIGSTPNATHAVPNNFPPVGPNAAGQTSARHLNIAQLSPVNEREL